MSSHQREHWQVWIEEHHKWVRVWPDLSNLLDEHVRRNLHGFTYTWTDSVNGHVLKYTIDLARMIQQLNGHPRYRKLRKISILLDADFPAFCRVQQEMMPPAGLVLPNDDISQQPEQQSEQVDSSLVWVRDANSWLLLTIGDSQEQEWGSACKKLIQKQSLDDLLR